MLVLFEILIFLGRNSRLDLETTICRLQTKCHNTPIRNYTYSKSYFIQISNVTISSMMLHFYAFNDRSIWRKTSSQLVFLREGKSFTDKGLQT